MVQRREPINRGKGRSHRPHHISAIAHHFLDEDGVPDASARLRRRDLAVCSPGSGPLGAWVCAGLARSLAAESVILGESPWLSWSATSYLSQADLKPVLSEEMVSERESADHRYWQILENSEDSPAGSKRPVARSEGIRIMLRNLGRFPDRHLENLESVHLPENLSGASLPGGDGLVWCLEGERALSLSAAYSLGRTLALLRPRRLEILVCDENWPDPGRARPRRASRDLLDRCRQLAVSVGNGLIPNLSTVGAENDSAGTTVEQVFQATGRRLLAADYSD
jgi:hypothetical protein